MLDAQWREWRPYVSPWDPCPPMRVKRYIVTPNQYMSFQPMNLPQYPIEEALYRGTLWPALFSPYIPKGHELGGAAHG